MDNLSKENLCIERFNICTCNLKDSSAFVEFGIEILKNNFVLNLKSFCQFSDL